MTELKDTTLFRNVQAIPSVPDPMANNIEFQVAADEILAPLGLRAPAPRPTEPPSDYMARLGEHAASVGPEDRKSINRYALPPAVLAEVVRQDFEIAKAEADTPNYSLRPGVPQTRQKADASGREFTHFYSADGPKFWMTAFMEPVVKYVSGGSKGILTPDHQQPHNYNFNKSQILPEIRELQRRAAYADSAEGRIVEMYRQAGREVPAELLRQITGQR